MEDGDRLYLWIGYMLISTAIFITLYFILGNIASGDAVYQNLYLTDVSTIESSILTSNGNLVVEYNISDNKGDYDITLKDNCEVRISDAGYTSKYKSFYCLNNEYIDKKEGAVNLDIVTFRLEDSTLVVEGV